MQKREDINTLDKWDLTKLYADENAIEEDFKRLDMYALNIKRLKGHLLSSYFKLERFFRSYIKLNQIIERLNVYSMLFFYQDMTNIDAINLKERVNKKIEYIFSIISFVEPEFLKASFKEVKELISDLPLAKYEFYFAKLFRAKKHILSSKDEQLLTKISFSLLNSSDIYDNLNNSDLKLESVIIDGKEQELTPENFQIYLNNRDVNIRKQAFTNLYRYYQKLNNTMYSLYLASIKENTFISQVRKYPSVLEMHLYDDKIPVSFLDNLVNGIHQGIRVLREYETIRKNYLNLKEMHNYDLYRDLVDPLASNISYEQAKTILFTALKPLGKDYANILKEALSNRWVDVYPNEGKRGGAYEISCFGADPYVSLNYVNDFDSVSTLAHELGHAIHSYLTNKKQDYMYQSYPIFLAEIASTVNECLIDEYFINNTKDKKEKIYYLNNFLEKFRTTVFRQLMFSEFETKVYNDYQNGSAINPEYLNNTYLELNKVYYGNTVTYDDEIKYEWSRIPHFYTPFYVYKYASGYIIALSIVSKLKKDNTYYKKYLEFLSSGSSKYPLDTLKIADIDSTLEEPIKDALEIFKNKVNELKNLVGGNNNGKE